MTISPGAALRIGGVVATVSHVVVSVVCVGAASMLAPSALAARRVDEIPGAVVLKN
jgi:hypothetical protein